MQYSKRLQSRTNYHLQYHMKRLLDPQYQKFQVQQCFWFRKLRLFHKCMRMYIVHTPLEVQIEIPSIIFALIENARMLMKCQCVIIPSFWFWQGSILPLLFVKIITKNQAIFYQKVGLSVSHSNKTNFFVFKTCNRVHCKCFSHKKCRESLCRKMFPVICT